jgi:hypothetical protein
MIDGEQKKRLSFHIILIIKMWPFIQLPVKRSFDIEKIIMKPIFSILQGIRKNIYMEKDSLMPKKKRTFQPIETLWTSFYVHQIKRVDSLIVHQKSRWLQSLESSPKYWTDLQSTYTSTCNSDIIKGNQEIDMNQDSLMPF